MKSTLEKVKNLKITKNLRMTMALVGMSGVLALTGCSINSKKEDLSAITKIAPIEDIKIEEKPTVTEIEEQEEEEIKEEKAEEDVERFDLSNCDLKNGSIVDALEACGYDSSFETRKALYAELFGDEPYTGAPEQNTKLLKKIIENSKTGKNPSVKEIEKKVSKENKDKENNKKENKNNKENKKDNSQKTETNQEDSKGQTSGGNNENDSNEDKKPENKPTPPDKQPDPTEHKIHNWSKWTSVDDEYEERTCSVGGEKEKRKHKMEITSSTTVPDNNGKHTTTTVSTCVNCGHTITNNKTEDCDYTIVISYDENGEVVGCVCTHNIPRIHRLATTPTVADDGSLVYPCETCDYKLVIEHTHSKTTEIIAKYKEADKCCRKLDTCSGCDLHDEYDDFEHDFEVVSSDFFEEVVVCHDCELRTTREKTSSYNLDAANGAEPNPEPNMTPDAIPAEEKGKILTKTLAE